MYLFPQWRPVPKYLGLKKALSFVVILLTTITSFTFFSRSIPALVWRDHARAYVVTRTVRTRAARADIARVLLSGRDLEGPLPTSTRS